MPWHLALDAPRHTICLSFEGHVSRADVGDSTAAVIDLMAKAGTARVLTDFTAALSLATTTLDILQRPQSYSARGFAAALREAVVAPPACKVLDAADFYETVCRNRGVQVRRFDDRASALAWLAAPPA